MVEEGEPAPDIELTTDTGERVKLSNFRGQTVVLDFCPKDESRPLLNEVALGKRRLL
jgi:peroxiredoxin